MCAGASVEREVVVGVTTIVSRICCPVLDIVPKPLWIEYTWTKVIYLQLSDHTLLNDILENKIYFSS